MTIPGANILSMAMNLIGQQQFKYYAFVSRTAQSNGQYLAKYASPVCIKGSVQAVPRNLYQEYGLEFNKHYLKFYVPANVMDVSRDVSGDLFTYAGLTYQCLQITPWYGIDGWVEALGVQVPNLVPTQNQNVGLLWPAYIYPAGSGLVPFTAFMGLMAQYPAVPCTVILIPPSTGIDANYAAILLSLQAAGARVILYDYTDYATRPVATVQAEIANLQLWYPTLNGIFLDQMSTDPTYLSYYQTLKGYINSLNINFVMQNPGTNTLGEYFTNDIADVFVTWENNVWPTQNQASNLGAGAPAQLGAIVDLLAYNATNFSIMTGSCNYVWATDQGYFDPGLPSYIQTVFQTLNSLAVNNNMSRPQ